MNIHLAISEKGWHTGQTDRLTDNHLSQNRDKQEAHRKASQQAQIIVCVREIKQSSQKDFAKKINVHSEHSDDHGTRGPKYTDDTSKHVCDRK